MGLGSLDGLEPAYAQKQVDDIDARLAEIKDETKRLQERRKSFVPFTKNTK